VVKADPLYRIIHSGHALNIDPSQSDCQWEVPRVVPEGSRLAERVRAGQVPCGSKRTLQGQRGSLGALHSSVQASAGRGSAAGDARCEPRTRPVPFQGAGGCYGEEHPRVASGVPGHRPQGYGHAATSRWNVLTTDRTLRPSSTSWSEWELSGQVVDSKRSGPPRWPFRWFGRALDLLEDQPGWSSLR
jgi:hypothetical protein